ncbi:MAG: amino acid ABC transporter permease [Pseudomonadota bacterium]|nr:amino acid ABC transporter permease [Pseudomonadota bacterium]
MNELLMGATWSDVADWIEPLSRGFVLNLEITFITILLGFPGGFVLALLVERRSPWVRWPAMVIVEIGRGAPALVLLQFVYFGFPQIDLTLSSFASAIVALSVSTACYTSEIIRSGLAAVPKGQKEAAEALNFSSADSMRFIVFPQAAKISSPAMMGFSILILQSTTLCFTIALPEIASQAYEIGSTTFQYFPILSLTALFFIFVCVPASFLVGWFERRSEP